MQLEKPLAGQAVEQKAALLCRGDLWSGRLKAKGTLRVLKVRGASRSASCHELYGDTVPHSSAMLGPKWRCADRRFTVKIPSMIPGRASTVGAQQGPSVPAG